MLSPSSEYHNLWWPRSKSWCKTLFLVMKVPYRSKFGQKCPSKGPGTPYTKHKAPSTQHQAPSTHNPSTQHRQICVTLERYTKSGPSWTRAPIQISQPIGGVPDLTSSPTSARTPTEASSDWGNMWLARSLDGWLAACLAACLGGWLAD